MTFTQRKHPLDTFYQAVKPSKQKDRKEVAVMTSKERFDKLLHFSPDLDRAPVVEWATWWTLTIDRWKQEGLPQQLSGDEINAYWGQDKLHQFWQSPRDEGCPVAPGHGLPIIHNEEEYEAIHPHLYTDQLLDRMEKTIRTHLREHGDEGFAYWFTLEGFFWYPRTLFGIEDHLYAFYDYPELMHRMNQELADFHKRTLEVIYSLVTPSFMTFAEDMSYNHGPMLSKEQFDEFMLPYYQQVVPIIRSHGTKVFIDTDGFVEPLIPWFLQAGIEGVLPLERMAGVDVNRIRQTYPDFLMIGGFDKTVMHKGEAAMRAEFERLLPVIRSGGYIPSVDHQTPPDVDMDTYRVFMKLLREYTEQAGKDRA